MTTNRISPSGPTLVNVPPALITQSAWYVDSVLGDDNNPGTSTAPLKTLQEFWFRTAGGLFVNDTSISLTGDFSTQDLILDFYLASGKVLTVTGLSRTTIYGPVALTAVVAQNPAGQQRQQIQDGAALGAADNVGKMLRLTSGANAGAVAGALKTTAADTLLTTQFVTFSATGSFTGVFPAPGDLVVVETLTPVRNVLLNVKWPSNTLTTPIRVTGLDISGITQSLAPVAAFSSANQTRVYGCRFTGQSIAGLISVSGCLAAPSGTIFGYQVAQVLGGGTIASAGVTAGNLLNSVPLIITNNHVIQGRLIPGALITVGDLGIFDSSGSGITIGNTKVVQPTGGASLLWGNGHAAYGVNMFNGGIFCQGGSSPPILTGASGDTLTASVTVATWAAAVFNEAKNTGTVVP